MLVDALKITPDRLISVLTALDYPVFRGDYNLNLIGIRAADHDANTFNDLLCVLYQTAGRWHLHCFDFTTDPGVPYREQPINEQGTAVLVPGHYRACWQVGLHQGQYEALVQRRPMSVWRDNNRDSKLDMDGMPIESGLFGINLHRANPRVQSKFVGRWSAGCQVIANPRDFTLLMSLVDVSVARYGKYLSYSLLTEAQLCVDLAGGRR